jgi:hypothetical protein
MDYNYDNKIIIEKNRKLKLKLKSRTNKKWSDIKSPYNINRLYRCYARSNVSNYLQDISNNMYDIKILDDEMVVDIYMPKMYKKTKTWWERTPHIKSIKQRHIIK